MNFPNRWRLWIKGVLKSAKASTLINGSPSKEFLCSRGIRQGDPLSPFLFLIAMESLNWMLQKARELGVFREINTGKCSLLGINVPDCEVSDLANIAQCKVVSCPFSYLGLIVGANMNLAKIWKQVIDTFEARLSSWKTKNLSIGGRVVLIRAVLDSLPVYFFSLYKAPNKDWKCQSSIPQPDVHAIQPTWLFHFSLALPFLPVMHTKSQLTLTPLALLTPKCKTPLALLTPKCKTPLALLTPQGETSTLACLQDFLLCNYYAMQLH
ncbi:hypothetical protein L1987_36740 [Smallanthus sonchifolius]|uniref:Uncharacterized protein n=1 Tax=Smallanthus sonchifolius TaxID=185202 RepID=A0ACB9HF95_9ASTR|nr:hypothetical protein L1987_36740 [Smallanthus sonchifolius]